MLRLRGALLGDRGTVFGLREFHLPPQRRFIGLVAQKCGLVLDPVYSGKALFGLSQMDPKPRRVLFLHTGGLPGLLAQADVFGR